MSSDMEEDVDTLLRRARELVNPEFRQRSYQDDHGKENSSPNSSQRTTRINEAAMKSKFESVKDARRRIQQEWEALKNSSLTTNDSIREIVQESRKNEAEKNVLYGVVAYVEIGGNPLDVSRLKSILTTLGATVKDSFTKEVTHVVYKNGAIETYKRAKLLNSHLVSGLWVEACRNSKSKVCERLFPVFDTNDYSNSPRVFRRFMEYQSKHFEYDASIGEIVRKAVVRQKPQSLIKNLQNLNIGNFKNTTNAKNIDKVKEKSPTKRLRDKCNSSEESVRLHVSTDDSGTNVTSNENISTNTSSNASSVSRPSLERSNAENVCDNLRLQHGDEQSDRSEDVSPSKRRLFAKRPLQESFRNYSQEESVPRRIIVPNPYRESNPKNDASKKTLPMNKNDVSAKQKQKSPVKNLNTDNKKNGKDASAIYNGIKHFNCIFKKTHNAFRPPSKYVYSEHKKCPSLVSTSLHSQENQSLKRVVTRLGGFHLKPRVDGSTTHVVCGDVRRTVNLLKAVARGCWVLNRQWLEESASAGRWLAEEHYELVEFSKIVRRSRIQKQSFGKDYSLDIFDECGLIYVSLRSAPPCKDLKELVTLCGGRVTTHPGSAQIIVGEVVGSCPNCVTEKWILDSITFGRCKTISKYYLRDAIDSI